MATIVFVATCLLLQETDTSAERRSIHAGTIIILSGASEETVHGFYLGKKPKLPILDDNGNIHPCSCNPSYGMNKPEFDKDKLNSLLPHLKNLRPTGEASHVGIYLSDAVFKDEEFVNKLQKQLPKCRIFRHSREETQKDIQKRATHKIAG